MKRAPAIHIRSDEAELVTLDRKLWSELMHELDPDSSAFSRLLVLGLPHWDDDLEDLPHSALDAGLAER